MTEWWAGLSPREKTLIGVAGGLTALVGFVLLVIAPAHGYRQSAERNYTAARALLDDVETGVAEARALSKNARVAPSSPDAVRSAASGLARSMGVSINTVQPSERGVSMLLSDIDAKLLFQWLDRLQREHGVNVMRASIRANDDAQTVRADIVFGVGAAP
ncbi:MAG: type II secretion system protein M [Pseudomonadota bacterium]